MVRIVVVAALSFIAAILIAVAIGVHMSPMIVALFAVAVLAGAAVALGIERRRARSGRRSAD